MSASYPEADTTGLPILPEVDPRGRMPGIFDQGQLGSCTANATAAAFQYEAILDGHDPGPLSRLWVYYWERSLEHSLGAGDTGAYGHDAYKVAKHGIPSESLWPYDISTFEGPPPAAADATRAYTLTKPVHTPRRSQNAFQQVLSNNQTIAFGFTVYDSFESQWATPGIMPVPKPGEQILGGHEILIVGYLQTHPHYFLVRNSWGGPKTALDVTGYFLYPTSVLLDPNIASDFRTIVRS